MINFISLFKNKPIDNKNSNLNGFKNREHTKRQREDSIADARGRASEAAVRRLDYI